MEVLTSLQEAIAGAAERVGPSVVGLGRGWGLGSGVVIGDGHVLTNAHNVRREQVTVVFADGRRETGEWTAADPDLDLAVISVDTGDAARRWPGSPATRRASARRCWRWPTPAGAGCGRRSASSRRRGAASAGRAGGASRGRSSTRAPLPRGSSGGPLVDADGRLLGLNALRLDGGLIVAVPATAAVKERVQRLARGEASASPRLGVAIAPRAGGAPHAPRGRPAGARRACSCAPSRTAARRPPPASRPATCSPPPTAASSARSTSSTRLLDAVSGGGSLELTVVRGTEERTRRRSSSRRPERRRERRGGGPAARRPRRGRGARRLLARGDRGGRARRPVRREPARDAARARRPGAVRAPAAPWRSPPTASC